MKGGAWEALESTDADKKNQGVRLHHVVTSSTDIPMFIVLLHDFIFADINLSQWRLRFDRIFSDWIGFKL